MKAGPLLKKTNKRQFCCTSLCSAKKRIHRAGGRYRRNLGVAGLLSRDEANPLLGRGGRRGSDLGQFRRGRAVMREMPELLDLGGPAEQEALGLIAHLFGEEC